MNELLKVKKEQLAGAEALNGVNEPNYVDPNNIVWVETKGRINRIRPIKSTKKKYIGVLVDWGDGDTPFFKEVNGNEEANKYIDQDIQTSVECDIDITKVKYTKVFQLDYDHVMPENKMIRKGSIIPKWVHELNKTGNEKKKALFLRVFDEVKEIPTDRGVIVMKDGTEHRTTPYEASMFSTRGRWND